MPKLKTVALGEQSAASRLGRLVRPPVIPKDALNHLRLLKLKLCVYVERHEWRVVGEAVLSRSILRNIIICWHPMTRCSQCLLRTSSMMNCSLSPSAAVVPVSIIYMLRMVIPKTCSKLLPRLQLILLYPHLLPRPARNSAAERLVLLGLLAAGPGLFDWLRLRSLYVLRDDIACRS